jgi:hypothetical protein
MNFFILKLAPFCNITLGTQMKLEDVPCSSEIFFSSVELEEISPPPARHGKIATSCMVCILAA